MEKKIARFLIIFIIALLQVSFFPNFFSGVMTPGAAVGLVISWIITCGFSEIYLWIIALGALLDIFSFQQIGFNPIALMIIAYLVSFFSKRFLIGHKFWGMLVLGAFIILGTALYFFITPLILNFSGLEISESMDLLYFPIKPFLREVAINIILFVLIYFPLKKIENFLSYYDKRIKVKR